jgi:spore coat protein A, manganese oxidase
MINRRRFLQAGAGAAAFLAWPRRAYPFAQSPLGITKFTVPLPGLGPTGIPVLTPNKTKFPGTDYYEIEAAQFTQQLHPAIPTTTFWGYADAASKNHRYLGGVIVATHGTPVKLKITNALPARHILPVDPTLVDPTMLAETGGRQDRTCVHLHGGLVFWDDDGGPFSWFSNPNNPGGLVHGSSFINKAGVPGAAIYDYPNGQSARFVWYHDHAYSLTRINAYAGIATAYLITDSAESLLIQSGVLPNFDGYPLGIPLVIQDKTFWDGPRGHDPYYGSVPPAGASTGSLWYPHIYEGPPLAAQTLPPICGATGRWDSQGGAPPVVSTVPEFFSDIILVNGAPYPGLGPLPPRRLRFRFLNGSQARFYNLQLYVADGSPDGITLAPTGEIDTNGNPILAPKNAPGPAFIQIGSEAGFLPAPAIFSKDGTNKNSNRVIGFKAASNPLDPTNGNVSRYNLVIAPAERPDVIIDFRGFEGQKLILYNDAPAPFPGGDIRNDYYGGDFDLTCIGGAPSTKPGFGPDTRVLMRFEVGTSGGINELSFAQTVAALEAALPITFLTSQPTTLISPDHGTKVKTLNEDFDSYGRLRQRLGAPGATDYLSIPTDVAQAGEVQRWMIFNLTGDTHPMHFHLVNVTIRKREAWKFNPSTGDPILPLQAIPGTARPADPNEQGWKETVRMNPGEVVTVDMKFDLPKGTPPPPSPRLQASYGIRGAEYVWHCHILEHEEHDMMHALVVI